MNIETIHRSPGHFEEQHEDGAEIVCMQHNNQCNVLVEIRDASEQEQEVLAKAAERALTRLDEFFDGRFAELFSGLHIQIGDGLVKGGAEALPEKNRIKADRRKMLMSVEESEPMLVKDGYFEIGDRTRVMSAEEISQPASSLEYELIHEVGHLLDEQAPGEARHRISAAESPTKYGREPDHWHKEKDHEAFAEGFAYMVFGAKVSLAMKEAIESTISTRVRHD